MTVEDPTIMVDAKGEIVREIHMNIDDPELKWKIDKAFKDRPEDHLHVDFLQGDKRVEIWFGDEEDVNGFIETLEKHIAEMN